MEDSFMSGVQSLDSPVIQITLYSEFEAGKGRKKIMHGGIFVQSQLTIS